MVTKRRFSFWKVLCWVALVNALLLGTGLLVIFYVRIPYQPVNLASFNVGRYCLRGIASILFQSVMYFFTLNQYYRFLITRRKWPAWLGWSLLYLLAWGCWSLVCDWCARNEDYSKVSSLSMKVFAYSFSSIFQVLIPLLIVAVFRQLDEKKLQKLRQIDLEQQKAQLEKEKMQADYLFLKAQINPHFLHNTLNFLYARSLPYSPELSEGILTLSQIMRYSLSKEEDDTGKVLLSQEIAHVHNIIKIQQLRFGHALQVQFRIQGNPEDLRILPFVLITLVENAFKHGDLKNPAHPVLLELTLLPERKLQFLCSNRKKTGPRELSTGIGLDNTRKRLDLAYGQNYALYIKDQKETYTVDLNIEL